MSGYSTSEPSQEIAVELKQGVLPDVNTPGRWTWYDAKSDTMGGSWSTREEARQEYRRHREKGLTVEPSPNDVQLSTPQEEKETKPVKTKQQKTIRKAVRATKTAKSAKRNKGAVAKCWAIFDKMPKARRKDAVAAAIKAGMKPNTARSQYQSWRHRGDK